MDAKTFNHIMETGFNQAKNGESENASNFFSSLKKETKKTDNTLKYTWRNYTPNTMDYVEKWLDKHAIKMTGMDDGFRDFYEYWANEDGFIVSENFWCKVVFENEEPFAVIAFGLHEGTLHIMETLVATKKRGQGKGSGLLKELIENGKKIIGFDIYKAEAVIYPSNKSSQKAFEKAGFKYHCTHEDGDAMNYVYESDAVIDSIKNKYLSNNKADVLKHVEDVADIAVELAKIYDVDISKITLAALLHDISTIMTSQEMYDFAKARGLKIDPAEENYHALLHQRISRIIAEEDFNITDSDILNAIECHATLKKNASLYDKIIFLADKISWDTKFKSLYSYCLGNKTVDALNEACYNYIKYQFDNNLLVMPHQWIIEAYEDLKKN